MDTFNWTNLAKHFLSHLLQWPALGHGAWYNPASECSELLTIVLAIYVEQQETSTQEIRTANIQNEGKLQPTFELRFSLS